MWRPNLALNIMNSTGNPSLEPSVAEGILIEHPRTDLNAEAFDMRHSGKMVVVLVGLIASGKSTFAQALEDILPHRFRRCNQDELGDRRAVEALARQSLRQNISVVIDRTNFDSSQRATWINLAREFTGTSVFVIVFNTPPEECRTRLEKRTHHPTIHSVQKGLQVLNRFLSDYRSPTADEGWDRLLYLAPEDQAVAYDLAKIMDIFDRLSQEPLNQIGRPCRGRYAHHPRGYRSHWGQRRGRFVGRW